MRIILALTLALTLAACGTLAPPTIDDTPPAILDPITPIPDPAPAYAPVGTCPLLITLDEQRRTFDDGTGATRGPAIIAVTLGDPCAFGDQVPFAFREQLLWDNSFIPIIDGVLTHGATVHGRTEVRFAVPFEARARRFEILDYRDGSRVAVQNYRFRVPR